MDITLPVGYKMLFGIMAAKSRNPSTMSVLELGCADGSFVAWLRRQGYEAEGVDGDSKAIERAKRFGTANVHFGQLASLDDVLGARTFGLIVARGVFSIGTQFYHLFNNMLSLDKLGEYTIDPERDKALLEQAQRNIEQILMSAFQHLKPGGFLITCDNILKGDCVAFSRETAAGMGYRVKHYERQRAVLEKPLQIS